MLKEQSALNYVLKCQREFNPRGSKCPICRKWFRKGCDHTVTQARDTLAQRVFNARLELSQRESKGPPDSPYSPTEGN